MSGRPASGRGSITHKWDAEWMLNAKRDVACRHSRRNVDMNIQSRKLSLRLSGGESPSSLQKEP